MNDKIKEATGIRKEPEKVNAEKNEEGDTLFA